METRKRMDKGVAGLTILLSLVVFLFIIGLLVMIFSLMGGNLQDAVYDSTNVAIANESVTLDGTAQTLAGASKRNAVCGTIPTQLINETIGGAVLGVTNVTLTSTCTVTNATVIGGDFIVGTGVVFLSYSYKWDADNTATDVMNDTASSIATVSDWFPIFIVIGAMVVLILLTVIIISSIRGSGMISGGESA